MKSMKIGDMAFFYHSVTDKEIVGIMQVMGEYYLDHTDRTDKFGTVEVYGNKSFFFVFGKDLLSDTQKHRCGTLKHEVGMGQY